MLISWMGIGIGCAVWGRMGITKLVLDVLKTLRGSTIIDVAHKLLEVDGVSRISIKVDEVGVEVVVLTITIEGTDIDFDGVKSVLEGMGAVVHSVDEVAATRDGGI
ncbi:MAG: DUF211 domain-containing protein [Ignisphaera sp.]|nr:DUF211 domain-containing protein [Ignisphaera sp.]MCX8168029.1 DUF211 domain-containing protein [Ignisphaera sp.]MDW8085500.1 DUF211 domain-containing protein [Ignisphaera sp.]